MFLFVQHERECYFCGGLTCIQRHQCATLPVLISSGSRPKQNYDTNKLICITKRLLTNYIILSLICQTTSRNPLKLSAHTSFLNLALSLLLRVFKVTPVTKFHQVTRLADFALESTKRTLNGLTITNVNLDFDIQWGRRSYKKGGGEAMGTGEWCAISTSNQYSIMAMLSHGKFPPIVCIQPDNKHVKVSTPSYPQEQATTDAGQTERWRAVNFLFSIQRTRWFGHYWYWCKCIRRQCSHKGDKKSQKKGQTRHGGRRVMCGDNERRRIVRASVTSAECGTSTLNSFQPGS